MRVDRAGKAGEKTFPSKVKITIFAQFVDPTLLRSPRGRVFFLAPKRQKKWGNPIRFLPPPSALFSSLRFLPVALSSFVSLLYGQIRLPAVGIITEWERRRRRRLLHLTFAFSVLCLNELKRCAVDLPPAPLPVPMNVTSAAI